LAAGDSFTQFEFALPVALAARQRHGFWPSWRRSAIVGRLVRVGMISYG